MYKLANALFEFKDRIGSNECVAKDHLFKLCQPNYRFRQKPLSHNLLKDRMNFVEQGVNEYFEQNNISFMQPSPLNNGAESLVFDCANGYVAKVRSGAPYKKCSSKILLPSVKTDYSQNLNVTYDIFPKARIGEVSSSQIRMMFFKGLLEGNIIHDHTPHNFGYIKTGKNNQEEETLVLVDAGAMRSISGIQGAYALARTILRPVYHRLPFLRAYGEAFKGTVDAAFGFSDEAKNMATPTYSQNKTPVYSHNRKPSYEMQG